MTEDDAIFVIDNGVAPAEPQPPLVITVYVPPIMTQVQPDSAAPRSFKSRAAEGSADRRSAAIDEINIAVAAPVVIEPIKPTAKSRAAQPEPTVAALDQRPQTLVHVQTSDKPVLALPDRLAQFVPLITDAVRDIVSIARDRELHFSVRPDTLGQVAVTIERGDAGLGLRLGVETPTAVQAVRQAEPILNDSRGNAPFAHVTVELTSSDQRGRPARAAMIARRGRDDINGQIETRTTALTGRYA